MFASLGKAFATLFDRDFRGLVFWTLFCAALLFVGLVVGVEYAVARLPPSTPDWLRTLLEVAGPLAVLALIFALGAPIAAMIGSLFLDRIAARVDAHFYPGDPKARGTSRIASFGDAIRLIGLALLINLALLPADIGVPGLAEGAAVLVNGWLLGREFFELAALRHLPRKDADALRRRHRGKIYFSGVVIALFTAIPLLDLIAPFFGTALMAHLYKRIAHQEGSA